MRFTGGLDFTKAAGNARQGTERGLDLALEYLLGEANQTAPIEEDTMIRSGTTARKGLKGNVHYDSPYAARQHEEMTWAHDEGRRAKWLELTFNEEIPAVKEILAKAIRGAL
jgi:hypothetical protein